MFATSPHLHDHRVILSGSPCNPITLRADETGLLLRNLSYYNNNNNNNNNEETLFFYKWILGEPDYAEAPFAKLHRPGTSIFWSFAWVYGDYTGNAGIPVEDYVGIIN